MICAQFVWQYSQSDEDDADTTARSAAGVLEECANQAEVTAKSAENLGFQLRTDEEAIVYTTEQEALMYETKQEAMMDETTQEPMMDEKRARAYCG